MQRSVVKCARWRKTCSHWDLQWRFFWRALGLVVFWDVVIDEGFSVELSLVDFWFLHDGTSHEAC
jgi:hypothetical protein